MLLLTAGSALPVGTASMTRDQLELLGKALAFMEPPLSGRPVMAIVYREADANSRHDAEALAELAGDVRFGGVSVQPQVVSLQDLGTVRFQVVVTAAGVDSPAVMQAARGQHALCMTADVESVRAGHCTLAIRTASKVEIFLNRDAMAQSGIAFATAFRMMVQEQ